MSIVLTGDRPSGSLHLGHAVGSLESRKKMQNDHEVFILIADIQALTDNYKNPQLVQKNVLNLMEDYLAFGLDASNIFLQSQIKGLFELTIYFMNLVTLGRVGRNPTVKAEMKQKGFEDSIPCGFFCYPISQAADILAFNADFVPVGDDQLPMIEQTNEVARSFNSHYSPIFKECKAIVSDFSRLMGIDGNAKASKSLNNCIFLNEDSKSVKDKVMSMYTDPDHIHVHQPGKVEGNMVFHYLDAFDSDKEKVQELKEDYKKGGLGDVVLKRRLIEVLEAYLEPVRQRRADLNKSDLMDILNQGNAKANTKVEMLMDQVRSLVGVKLSF